MCIKLLNYLYFLLKAQLFLLETKAKDGKNIKKRIWSLNVFLGIVFAIDDSNDLRKNHIPDTFFHSKSSE